MSKAQQTLAQAFLERISRGAVPMGGFYWVDPKALRSQSKGAEATAGQPSAMVSRPAGLTQRPASLAQRIGLFLIGAHTSIREPSETVSSGCTQHAPGERS
jgi:hypothetical protein